MTRGYAAWVAFARHRGDADVAAEDAAIDEARARFLREGPMVYWPGIGYRPGTRLPPPREVPK